MNQLLLLIFFGLVAWLIRRDTRRRDGISSAIWIPTIWLVLLTVRPPSSWLGFGGGESELEGSPLDSFFYLCVIAAAFYVLRKRNIDWPQVFLKNWPFVLYFTFFLISVLWAYSPLASFKRWIKLVANITMALIILTEVDFMQAFQAVFLRCAYILIPLSLILIRYFPNLGRRFTNDGGLEPIGVTDQKNSLGALVMVCGIVLIWEMFHPHERKIRRFVERLIAPIVLAIGFYLLFLCDSATSIFCLFICGFILLAGKVPFLSQKVGAFGLLSICAIIAYFVLDSMIGITDWIIVSLMGRSLTLTGRTDVWHYVLSMNTDPLFGAGYCSFWSDPTYLSKLPNWLHMTSHNGYLDTYIDGGWIGVTLLAIVLIVTAFREHKALQAAEFYPLVRFTVLILALVGDLTESHFGKMSPVWFLFVITAIEFPRFSKPLTSSPSPDSLI